MIRSVIVLLVLCGAALAQHPPQTAGDLHQQIEAWQDLKRKELDQMNERDRKLLEKQKQDREKAAKP